MDPEVFDTLHFLPDSIPGDDGHYKRFVDVYAQSTSEEHRPSLQAPHLQGRSLDCCCSLRYFKERATIRKSDQEIASSQVASPAKSIENHSKWHKQLSELNSLREARVLTEKEYQCKKEAVMTILKNL